MTAVFSNNCVQALIQVFPDIFQHLSTNISYCSGNFLLQLCHICAWSSVYYVFDIAPQEKFQGFQIRRPCRPVNRTSSSDSCRPKIFVHYPNQFYDHYAEEPRLVEADCYSAGLEEEVIVQHVQVTRTIHCRWVEVRKAKHLILRQAAQVRGTSEGRSGQYN